MTKNKALSPHKIYEIEATLCSFTIHPALVGYIDEIMHRRTIPSWITNNQVALQNYFHSAPVYVSARRFKHPKTNTSFEIFGGFSAGLIANVLPEKTRSQLTLKLAVYTNISQQKIKQLAASELMPLCILPGTHRRNIRQLYEDKDSDERSQRTLPDLWAPNINEAEW